MSAFRVSLYNDADDAQIGESFLLSVLPYPGLRVLHGGGCWEVVRVQLSIAQPGSINARTGAPAMVDAMVIESTGVHHSGLATSIVGV